MRALLPCWIVVVATLASCDRGPSRTPPSSPPDPPAEPERPERHGVARSTGASNDPRPRNDEPTFSAECMTGPQLARPGVAPLYARRVALDSAGLLETTVLRIGAPSETNRYTAQPALLTRVRSNIRSALAAAPYGAESSVPDGMQCSLSLEYGTARTQARVAVPTAHIALQPLVADIVGLLPTP